MRTITEIAVHCTATPAGRDYSVADITAMHKARGFSTIGYHYLIGLNGAVREGRPVEQVGAHVAEHNANSIGVSYVGGLTADGKKAADTRTQAQKTALRDLIGDLIERFPTIRKVQGHRDYSPDLDGDGEIEPREWIKACPCFDAIPEYADLLKSSSKIILAGSGPGPFAPIVDNHFTSPGDRPALRIGASGAAVTRLQRALKLAGSTVSVDGKFGPATKAAVERYQRSKGLKADGLVGERTWRELLD